MTPILFGFREFHGEFRLLFNFRGAAGRHDRDRGRGGHAELFFKDLHEFREVKHGELLDRIDDPLELRRDLDVLFV